MENENKDVVGAAGTELVTIAPAFEDCGTVKVGLGPCSVGLTMLSAGVAGGMNGVEPDFGNEKGEVDVVVAAAGNDGTGVTVGAAVFASGALKLNGEG